MLDNDTKRKSVTTAIANMKMSKTNTGPAGKASDSKATGKAKAAPGPSSLPALDLVQDKIKLASLTFGINLYTDELFSKNGDKVTRCLEEFLKLCPRENLRFYATTNMRVHKPTTARTFGMLSAWLRPGAPPMDYIDLELKDGNAYQDAPRFKFAVSAGEKGSVRFKGKHANILSLAFPAEWGIDRPADMLSFVIKIASIFPFQSGLAGFAFECSRYRKEESQTHAWQESMRHRGVDIVRLPTDAKAVGHDALKGVGWLTLLGAPILERLGGLGRLRRSLGDAIQFIDLPNGVILKAGAAPASGDRNRDERLPLYAKVYDAISPLVETASKRSMSFNLVEDFVERTEAWFARLSDE
jgi:hypothetical protein